jgi:hypothetical protein
VSKALSTSFACALLAIACSGDESGQRATASGGTTSTGAAPSAGRSSSTMDASMSTGGNGGTSAGSGGGTNVNGGAGGAPANGSGGGVNAGANDDGGASGGAANGGTNGDGGAASGGAGGRGSGGAGGSGPPFGTTEFCSPDRWCWQNPLPQGLRLADVFALSSSDVWAVGYYGTVLHYDGSDWRRVDSGTKGHLVTVFAVSHDDVYVGGELGLIHWNGHAFAPVAGAPTDWVNALWANGPNDLWVSGQSGSSIQRYRGPGAGFELTPVNASFGEAWDLLGFASDDVWAAGDSGYFFHRQGGTWTAPAGDITGLGLYSVWGTSSSDLWLGSTDGRLEHWDGTRLKATLLADPWWAQKVRGSGARDMWAILSQSPASGVVSRLGHYDGTSWTVVDPGGGGELDSVAALAPNDAWIVGHRGLMKHYDGKAFSADRSVSKTYVFSLWAASDTDVWAADSAGNALHFDGAVWKANKTPANALSSVFGLAPNDVWAAGDQIVHYDGKKWTSLATATVIQGRTAIWAAAPNDVWIGGFSSEFYGHFDGSKVTYVNPPSSFAVEGLWGFASDDVWSVGDYGHSAHWTGGVWADVETAITDHLYAVWGNASNDVWAVGASGHILRYRGIGWSAFESPTTQDLHAVWGRAANDIYAAGSSGILIHFDGTSWKAQDTGAGTDLNLDRFYAIGGTKTHTWATGALGMILGK